MAIRDTGRKTSGIPYPASTDPNEFYSGQGSSFQDLVLGAPFHIGGPGENGGVLADWLLAHHVDRNAGHAGLAEALDRIRLLCAAGKFVAAADGCRDATVLGQTDEFVFSSSAALFDFFAAALGDQDAALRVAANAVALAREETISQDTALALRAAALGWLSFAGLEDIRELTNVRKYAEGAAQHCIASMTRTWRSRQGLADRPATPTAYRNRDLGNNRLQEPPAEEEGLAEDEAMQPGHVVVLEAVGGEETSEGGRITKAYDRTVGCPLPLVPVPDLAVIRARLMDGYPQACEAIDAVLGELVGREHVRLPPLVFVGPPGSGKTAFCSALLEALGVPGLVYPCAGVSDAALGGSSRRWQTGEPCTPFSVMSARQVASPGIVLDELEKAGTSANNGRLHDVLLGMLEPSSSAHWHDQYLQADVDLSHVVWLATANSLEGLSRPLLDRCRILRVPAPRPEHLAVLSTALLRRTCADRGLDVRWAWPLDGVESEAVGAAWPGGSIRRLARLIEGVLAARNHAPVLQ